MELTPTCDWDVYVRASGTPKSLKHYYVHIPSHTVWFRGMLSGNLKRSASHFSLESLVRQWRRSHRLDQALPEGI